MILCSCMSLWIGFILRYEGEVDMSQHRDLERFLSEHGYDTLPEEVKGVVRWWSEAALKWRGRRVRSKKGDTAVVEGVHTEVKERG